MAEKGICDTCGETFRLLPNGKVPTHSTRRSRAICKGSRRPPEAMVERG